MMESFVKIINDSKRLLLLQSLDTCRGPIYAPVDVRYLFKVLLAILEQLQIEKIWCESTFKYQD